MSHTMLHTHTHVYTRARAHLANPGVHTTTTTTTTTTTKIDAHMPLHSRIFFIHQLTSLTDSFATAIRTCRHAPLSSSSTHF